MMRLIPAAFLSFLFLSGQSPALAGPSQGDLDKAYELNLQAMAEMSEAKFEEAVDHFRKAVQLVPDYGITGKPFIYSPTFMAGWGLEKIGNDREACAEFKAYLTRTGDQAEATKKEHADAFIKSHCK